MNAASQVPSGVLISTSVSTISMPMSAAAVDDDDTDAAMPAPTKRAAKSRRVMSPKCEWLLGWLFSSSVMVLYKEFIAFRWQTAPSDHQSPWAVRSLAFPGAGAGPPASSGSAAPLPAKTARSRPPVIPEIVTRFNCFDCCRANHNKMPQALPSPESLPGPLAVGSCSLSLGGHAASVFTCAFRNLGQRWDPCSTLMLG